MLKLYIIGICILIVAIAANALIKILGILSWYDFFELLKLQGSQAFKTISVLDYIWLILVYPFILSFGYLLGSKCYNWLFS